MQPKITVRSPSKITLSEGNVLYLKCQAEGVPTPLVTWRRNGQVIQRRTNDTNLIRENANEDYDGEYECQASNSVGSDSYLVEVIVKGKLYNNLSVCLFVVVPFF